MTKLFCFMGPSGSGKSTIQHALPMEFLTHYTTREIREGEVEGVHIMQIPREQFNIMWAYLTIATRTEYAGNLYGAPSATIGKIKDGTPYHATATAESIVQFKELLGDENVIVIYIKPPSIEVLRQRMLDRGDTLENVEKRIAHIFSAAELENEHLANYIVVNDQLDFTHALVQEIIAHELGLDNLDNLKKRVL